MQRTVGFSPKTIVATVAAILSYLLTQQLVDFPVVADLAVTAVLVGYGTYRAGPGAVQVIDPTAEKRDLHENPKLGV